MIIFITLFSTIISSVHPDDAFEYLTRTEDSCYIRRFDKLNFKCSHKLELKTEEEGNDSLIPYRVIEIHISHKQDRKKRLYTNKMISELENLIGTLQDNKSTLKYTSTNYSLVLKSSKIKSVSDYVCLTEKEMLVKGQTIFLINVNSTLICYILHFFFVNFRDHLESFWYFLSDELSAKDILRESIGLWQLTFVYSKKIYNEMVCASFGISEATNFAPFIIHQHKNTESFRYTKNGQCIIEIKRQLLENESLITVMIIRKGYNDVILCIKTTYIGNDRINVEIFNKGTNDSKRNYDIDLNEVHKYLKGGIVFIKGEYANYQRYLQNMKYILFDTDDDFVHYDVVVPNLTLKCVCSDTKEIIISSSPVEAHTLIRLIHNEIMFLGKLPSASISYEYNRQGLPGYIENAIFSPLKDVEAFESNYSDISFGKPHGMCDIMLFNKITYKDSQEEFFIFFEYCIDEEVLIEAIESLTPIYLIRKQLDLADKTTIEQIMQTGMHEKIVKSFFMSCFTLKKKFRQLELDMLFNYTKYIKELLKLDDYKSLDLELFIKICSNLIDNIDNYLKTKTQHNKLIIRIFYLYGENNRLAYDKLKLWFNTKYTKQIK